MEHRLLWLGLPALLLLGGLSVQAEGDTHFPAESWEWYEAPERAGFCSDHLRAVREASEKLDTAAVMIVYQGRVVDGWGDLERRFECHSLRKSFLSALYGVQAARGNVDLEATLADLEIDDNDPLSEVEKQATVRMLLQARSGGYHPALYETAAMAAARPRRHAY